jgi:hypothetical protein
MTATTTDADGCDECAALPCDFVCANCYDEGESLAGEDDADPGPIDDLTDLAEGDRVLWGDRSVPCDVVDTGFGSHVIVEGPNGATYRIQPIPNGGFRFGDRGGTVDDLRRVDTDGDTE